MQRQANREQPTNAVVAESWSSAAIMESSDTAIAQHLEQIKKDIADTGSVLDGPLDPVKLREAVESIVSEYQLTASEKEQLIGEYLALLSGYGKLKPLMEDKEITEVIADSFNKVYYQKGGEMFDASAEYLFRSDDELGRLIDHMIKPVGRPLDELNPILDGELPDGTRINATHPRIGRGYTLNLRKPPGMTHSFTLDQFVKTGAASPAMMRFIHAVIERKGNVVFVGPTGSGKSTGFRIALEEGVPEHERFMILEQTMEVNPRRKRFVAFQVVQREKNPITMEKLATMTLRKTPDRVGVGEIRGPEELVGVLKAILTGQDGALFTMHARNPRALIALLIIYASQIYPSLTPDMLRDLLHSSIDLIVMMRRFRDGRRRITEVTEVTPTGFNTIFRLDINDQHKFINRLTSEHQEDLELRDGDPFKPGDLDPTLEPGEVDQEWIC